MERINKYDTLKGLLAFGVILGHLIWLVGGDIFGRPVLYFIYSFHMPLFMVIAGRFAKFKPIDALFYVVLFFAFRAWFVLAVAVYYMFIPLFARITDRRKQAVLIALSIVAGLLGGFFPFVNEYLHRLLPFLPYFLIGYYRVFEWKPLRHKWLLCIIAASVTIASWFTTRAPEPMFMSNTYVVSFGVGQRVIIYCAGILWSVWMLNAATNHKIPIVTALGRSTLWIYLLHLPMLSFMCELTRRIIYSGRILPSVAELFVAIVWTLSLWPVSYALTKLSKWLMGKWAPINIKMQQKFMPQVHN